MSFFLFSIDSWLKQTNLPWSAVNFLDCFSYELWNLWIEITPTNATQATQLKPSKQHQIFIYDLWSLWWFLMDMHLKRFLWWTNSHKRNFNRFLGTYCLEIVQGNNFSSILNKKHRHRRNVTSHHSLSHLSLLYFNFFNFHH